MTGANVHNDAIVASVRFQGRRPVSLRSNELRVLSSSNYLPTPRFAVIRGGQGASRSYQASYVGAREAGHITPYRIAEAWAELAFAKSGTLIVVAGRGGDVVPGRA